MSAVCREVESQVLETWMPADLGDPLGGAPAAESHRVGAVSAGEFRQAMRQAASTVAVVTTGVVTPRGVEPVGSTVSSLVSVSLEPPLVSFSLRLGSASATAWQSAGAGVVHVLHERQHELARRFSGARENRFAADLPWHWEPAAGPVLDDALTWLAVRPVARLRAGDHVMVLALVTATRVAAGRRPMVYHCGGYGSVSAG